VPIGWEQRRQNKIVKILQEKKGETPYHKGNILLASQRLVIVKQGAQFE
jgi:hypothetical protein